MQLSIRTRTRKQVAEAGSETAVVTGYYLLAYDPLRRPARREQSLRMKSKRDAERMLARLEPLVRSGQVCLWQR